MNLKTLQAELTELLIAANFGQPPYEARQILLAALNLNDNDLILRGDEAVSDEKVKLILDWVSKRIDGMPLAYLSGKKGFYKNDFIVEPGVLVPRPETEFVVEVVLRRHKTKGGEIADLGCGSGCIGLSLLKERPEMHLFAVDLSPIACSVTFKNAQGLDLGRQVEVKNIDVVKWIPPMKLQVVVTNPPYIPEGDERVQTSVHKHEPHAALYSGADGLTALREWIAWAEKYLIPGGLFVTEIGAGQSGDVQEIMKRHGFEKIEIDKDLQNHERVLSAVKAR